MKIRKNVLIVDDNENIRYFIKSNLKIIRNLNFHEAENGLQALDIYKKNNIDLILLDIEMPVMNGIQFLEAINENKKIENKRSQVIIISGLLSDEIINETKNIGVVNYIKKPFKASNLIETIIKYL